MPLPKKSQQESPEAFMSRCMSDEKVKTEYPGQEQRTAVCLSRACEHLNYIDGSNLILQYKSEGVFKYKDPVTGEYYFFERQGIYKKNGRTLVYVSKSSEDNNQKHMEDYVFQDKEAALKMAEKLGLSGVHSHQSGDDKTLWMPGKNMEEFQQWYNKH